jgi:hypothetical protein
MTDVIVNFFLIGIAVLFTILLFFKNNALIAVISALAWAILSWYSFNNFYGGDPDYGMLVYGFGWFCIAMAITLVTSPLWLFKKVAIIPEKTDNREQWEIEDEAREKRMKRFRRYRPKKKVKRTVWNEDE